MVWDVWITYVKGAALRLFHPTVSSVLFGAGFCYCDTVSRWGRVGLPAGRGGVDDTRILKESSDE